MKDDPASPSVPMKDDPVSPSDPVSPGGINVDASVDELQHLVKQSRAEQAVISSKILALKGGSASTPGMRPGGGLGAAGASSEEVAALREQLSEADSMLLERDAEVEALRAQVRLMTIQLVDEPKSGAAWRQRYEEAQKRLEGMERDFQGMRVEIKKKEMQIGNMNSYLKVLMADKQVNGQQREACLGVPLRKQIRSP